MKKKMILKVLAIMSMIALVGCGKKEPTTQEITTTENDIIDNEIEDTTTEYEDTTTEEIIESYQPTENIEGFDTINLCAFEDNLDNTSKPFSHTIIDSIENENCPTCTWAIDEEGTIYCSVFAFGSKDLIFVPKVYDSGLKDLAFVEQEYGRIVAIDSQNNYFVSEKANEEFVSDNVQYEAYKKGTFTCNIQPIACYFDTDEEEKHNVRLDAINLDTGDYYTLHTKYLDGSSDVPRYDDGNWVEWSSKSQPIEGNIAQELNSWVLSKDGTLYGHQSGHTLMEEEPFEYTKDIKFTKLVATDILTGMYDTTFAIAEDGTIYILSYYNEDRDINKMVIATITGLEGDFEFGVHSIPQLTSYLIVKTTEGVYKCEFDYDNTEIENITMEKSEECTNANILKCYTNNCFLTNDGKVIRLTK